MDGESDLTGELGERRCPLQWRNRWAGGRGEGERGQHRGRRMIERRCKRITGMHKKDSAVTNSCL